MEADRTVSTSANGAVDKSDYTILEMIDYGSFGDIYKVKRPSDNKVYALKQIQYRGYFQDDPYIVGEIYCLTHLKHRNIIKLHEVLVNKGEINIIMEYANNENLQRYLSANEFVEFHQKHKIYCQILEGVRYCHSMDIAHRDLTPVNILLTEDMVVKLADFGLAVKCSTNDGDPLISTDYLGHTAYLPPEVLDHKPFQPKPTDVWSVAVTLLYLLFRDVPYHGLEADIRSDQLTHSWKSFVNDKTKELNIEIKHYVLELLENALQLCPKERSIIDDLVRAWDDIGPETIEEKQSSS